MGIEAKINECFPQLAACPPRETYNTESVSTTVDKSRTAQETFFQVPETMGVPDSAARRRPEKPTLETDG